MEAQRIADAILAGGSPNVPPELWPDVAAIIGPDVEATYWRRARTLYTLARHVGRGRVQASDH